MKPFLLLGLKSARRYQMQLGYCGLLLLATWLSLASMVSRDYDQAIREIEQNNDQIVRAYEEHVRLSLHAVEDQMLLIKTEHERAGFTPAIATMFQQAKDNPLLLQILVLDAAGNIKASVEPGKPGMNFADRSYFKAHLGADSGQTFISEPFVGRNTNKMVVLLSRRLNGPDGGFAGVVAVAIESAYFSNFYQAMELKPGQIVRIAGLDGIIRASWYLDDSETGRNMKQSYLFEKHLTESRHGRFFTKGRLYGIPRFFSYRTMPDYPLVIQVGIDAESALDEYRGRRDLYLGAASVSSLLILLFSGLAIFHARKQRRKDERWQLVVEGVNDGIWEWDAGTNRMFFSDRCKAILGHEPEEVGDNHDECSRRCHPDDLATMNQTMTDHLEGRLDMYNLTCRMRCKDGAYRWVRSRGKAMRDDTGRVTRVVGALTDIHMEKSATEALHRSELELLYSYEKYKAVLEQAFEAVALIDPDTWQIIEVNQRFSEWFGYSLPADAPLSRNAILEDGPGNQDKYDSILLDKGFLPVARRTFRHKNGTTLFMERSAKIVTHDSKRLVVTTYRNIADQLQQERSQQQDAAIARRIQQAQLACPPDSEYVALATSYHPCGDISGDLYHLEWLNDGQLLRGYLVDVTGHSLSTALYTSTLSVLLHEVAERDESLPEQLTWLNRQVCLRFAADAFAAAIAFELDLQLQQLRYVGAGITKFWAGTAVLDGAVTVAGSYLGIDAKQDYCLQTLPLSAGDRLVFVTDGMEQLLTENAGCPIADCRQLNDMLASLPENVLCRDDATAVCIRIKSLPNTMMSGTWPKTLKLNGFDDYRRLKGEVAKVLAEATGAAHSMHEVAVNEAIANALECRDGQARSQKARLKFNKVGNRLIVRVKTSRIGFAGNAVLQRLRSQPEAMFSFGEDASMGRGIPLMLSLSHRMTYNNEGTEVLLAWKLEGRLYV